MEKKIEKKRKTIINLVYYAMLLLLFYFFMRYAFGVLFPFILAFFVAMILQKPINKLTEKTHIKKSIVSAVIILLLTGIIITLISLLGVKIFSAFKDFGDYLRIKFGDIPNTLERIRVWTNGKMKFLPDSLEASFKSSFDTFIDSLKIQISDKPVDAPVRAGGIMSTGIVKTLLSKINFSTITSSLSGVLTTAKAIPSVLIAVVVSVISCCFIASDYDNIAIFLKNQSAKRNNSLGRAKQIVLSSLKKLIKAYGLIILITFAEMFIGLYALKLFGIYKGKWIFFISVGTALLDILPVFGTGTVLIPWSLYLLISGDAPMGIALLVLYAFITVMRQFIEPKFVAGQLGLPPFITIMGMYIGVKLFGIIGLFIVPLAIILIKILNDEGVIHLWENKKEEEKPKSEQKT